MGFEIHSQWQVSGTTRYFHTLTIRPGLAGTVPVSALSRLSRPGWVLCPGKIHFLPEVPEITQIRPKCT